MKLTLLILSLSFSFLVHSQNNSENVNSFSSDLNLLQHDHINSFDFITKQINQSGEPLAALEGEYFSFFEAGSFAKPLAPILTTNSSDLEICSGNSTRLTANSSSVIRWYTTPPPLGTAVGTGSVYITPALSTGYYTYYAIAEEEGIKSEISAMEVVMVYPNPELKISSSAKIICANQTATLSATGATYLEWENGRIASQLNIKPSHTITYKVTGINTAGCKSTAVYTQAVEECNLVSQTSVGLKNAGAADHLYKVYPNPTNGELHVSVNSISENTKVELYNAYGKLIYSSRITSEITALELKDHANGIYILRIYENDLILAQEKILKH